MSEYKKLLSCWHKLEHFSPAQLPDAKEIELLTENEPWKIPLKSNDLSKTIEYTIYLGVFEMFEVNEFIKKYFNDSKKDENFRNSKNCFASLKLDIDGKYLNDTFGISTLPWALSQLENNKIIDDNWSDEFEKIKNNLIEYIDITFKETITNSENEILKVSKIVNKNQLLKFQDKIESTFGGSIKTIKEIYFKRIEKYKSNKSTSDILNSFYIKDLEKIIQNYELKTSPKAFQDYINGTLNKNSKRIDLSQNIGCLINSLTPSNYPDGCWPSEYKLSLMQQFAVNEIFNNLSSSNQQGMFSVNGPPGTGKTTLLRDIIAPIIVKRAKELSKITNPSDGFKKIGTFKNEKQYTYHIYEPIKQLANAGILIASSNNGAVENISKELPLKEEVSKQYQEKIEYFKEVAENCISTENWGVFSAVLGNKQNRTNLISSIWYNKDYKDLQKTLKENKLTDNSGWNSIKFEFESKLEEINLEKNRLENFKKDYDKFLVHQNSLLQVSQDLKLNIVAYEDSKIQYENYKKKLENLNLKKSEILNELSIIKSTKPNFINYWLYKSKRGTYNKALEIAINNYNQISFELPFENEKSSISESNCKKLCDLVNKLEYEKSIIEKNLEQLTVKTNNAKLELKNNYADNVFWAKIESKESQESCPWYSSKLKKLQSELFIISIKLNEIFLLTANATSSIVSTTLAGFFDYLEGESKPSKIEIKAMWDTFFLVIPVISSTFASIQTMFKDLDKESIPWLFIDEAGQAIPQAAAGSIWRSKRVGVVGDPFQIEPVVTIPNSITDNISKYFTLNNSQISSELSVQSMADRINPLGSYLTINDKKEWIGIPLRIHRRCINPMFEISNSIAYDNSMFCSTQNPKSVKINFQTEFIHCTGNVKGKHFVQEQATIIKDILVNEIAIKNDLPDIFVITPFSEISFELSLYLYKHLFHEIKKYKDIENAKMNEWLKQHIGTVHTFQGKQAEGVILCLGLDNSSKSATSWASQKPNLLNVAITRAKYRFIAIGDKEIWLRQPYFNQLNKLG